MSAWTTHCAAMVGVSTLRAPIGATVSKATNSPRTTFARVTVCQKMSQELIEVSFQRNSSVNGSPQCYYRSLAAQLNLHKEATKSLQLSLFSEAPFFLSPVSSLQMWTSVCSREFASTAAVSIWTAPTNAPVAMVTKSPQTAKLVKVCKGLSM